MLSATGAIGGPAQNLTAVSGFVDRYPFHLDEGAVRFLRLRR